MENMNPYQKFDLILNNIESLTHEIKKNVSSEFEYRENNSYEHNNLLEIKIKKA